MGSSSSGRPNICQSQDDDEHGVLKIKLPGRNHCLSHQPCILKCTGGICTGKRGISGGAHGETFEADRDPDQGKQRGSVLYVEKAYVSTRTVWNPR